MSLSFGYSSYNIPNNILTLVKFKNNQISALTSLNTLTSLSNSDYTYEYYPNINLCAFLKANSNTNYGFSLGTYPTSLSVSSYQINWIYSYPNSLLIYYATFSGSTYFLTSINYNSGWTTSSFTKVTGIQTTNSWGTYTIAFSSTALTFPEGSYMILTFANYFNLLD